MSAISSLSSACASRTSAAQPEAGAPESAASRARLHAAKHRSVPVHRADRHLVRLPARLSSCPRLIKDAGLHGSIERHTLADSRVNSQRKRPSCSRKMMNAKTFATHAPNTALHHLSPRLPNVAPFAVGWSARTRLWHSAAFEALALSVTVVARLPLTTPGGCAADACARMPLECTTNKAAVGCAPRSVVGRCCCERCPYASARRRSRT